MKKILELFGNEICTNIIAYKMRLSDKESISALRVPCAWGMGIKYLINSYTHDSQALLRLKPYK